MNARALLSVALPLLPIGPYLGFTSPAPVFFGVLLVMMIAFVFVLEGLKRLFYSYFVSTDS